MKTTRLPLPITVLVALALAGPASAATIYSNLRDIAIPLNFTGVYLDVDAGTTNSEESTGWDFNPFFGGTGVAGSPAFQPARSASGNTDTMLRLTVGATVNAGRFFSTGYGNSQTHLGPQFTDGQEGYLGFKFTMNNAAGPFYGWMRVVFTGNTAGALIRDWAYDDGGSAIVTSRVLQSAPSGNAQVVTLSPGTGEAFTLGSAITNTGGNTNSVLKTGVGTTTLAAANTYTGGTTISGGVLIANTNAALGASAGTITILGNATLRAGGAISTTARTLTLGTNGGRIDTDGNTVTFGVGSIVTGTTLTKVGAGKLTLAGTQTYATLNTEAGRTDLASALGSGSSTLNANAETNIGVSQTLAALNIGNGAVVTLSAPLPPAPAEDQVSGVASFGEISSGGNNVAGSVPEPCGTALLFGGFLTLLGFQRAPRKKLRSECGTIRPGTRMEGKHAARTLSISARENDDGVHGFGASEDESLGASVHSGFETNFAFAPRSEFVPMQIPMHRLDAAALVGPQTVASWHGAGIHALPQFAVSPALPTISHIAPLHALHLGPGFASDASPHFLPLAISAVAPPPPTRSITRAIPIPRAASSRWLT